MTPNPEDKPFTPVGQPLPLEALLKLAEVKPTEAAQAVASAHPSLMPFLLASR